MFGKAQVPPSDGGIERVVASAHLCGEALIWTLARRYTHFGFFIDDRLVYHQSVVALPSVKLQVIVHKVYTIITSEVWRSFNTRRPSLRNERINRLDRYWAASGYSRVFIIICVLYCCVSLKSDVWKTVTRVCRDSQKMFKIECLSPFKLFWRVCKLCKQKLWKGCSFSTKWDVILGKKLTFCYYYNLVWRVKIVTCHLLNIKNRLNVFNTLYYYIVCILVEIIVSRQFNIPI